MKMRISLLRETVRALIQENVMEDALTRAFDRKDDKSIEYAVKMCLNSGLPMAKCNDAINAFVEKTGDTETGEKITELLDDPENWHKFNVRTPREKMISKLNI